MKKPLKNIVLIGMPGSGKTTVGRILSSKLNKKFVDIDEYIEKQQGCSIPEIFKNGEEYFRSLELRAVEQISIIEDVVISTGGGVIKYEKNMLNLKQKGIIIFIDRPLNDIIQDLDTGGRPLLKNNIGEIKKIFKHRYSIYRYYCDFFVKNTGTLEKVLEDIIKIYNSNI
ncbi:shikimate kinase [Clostridium luticellarii]|jgi:shikimate kinase|uniref:Shikimate kinase n=1 Tax=Clostridium luticellarii TaxID=1691940 RepID=A0A2T0BG47_9CLOT|nr:shikimate kinase [Clostridium luticellarii]MCI1944855.1 shikimate kinase [Clostridium luticellarii]MCI1968329.1 shikimate kinase [Clostridium luticellarii]MCI1995327.1 shikimate kinase [Clostridium luticellarii]MCI2039411.1 shikimate kinase [Clostridium luticellarii]PRR82870.1 Shikimate kinase [Clostridium luticellarii]